MGHGYDETGIRHVSDHAQTSRKLYPGSLHVLQVDRMVDVAHAIDISELNRQLYPDLHTKPLLRDLPLAEKRLPIRNGEPQSAIWIGSVA